MTNILFLAERFLAAVEAAEQGKLPSYHLAGHQPRRARAQLQQVARRHRAAASAARELLGAIGAA